MMQKMEFALLIMMVKLVELNNLYAEMFGYEKNELIGKDYSTLIAGDSHPCCLKKS